jgi:hypothetical protein
METKEPKRDFSGGVPQFLLVGLHPSTPLISYHVFVISVIN